MVSIGWNRGRSTASINSSSLPHFDRFLLTLSTISIALLYILYYGYTLTKPNYPPGSLPNDARGNGAGSCQMSFMSPSYLHLSNFDRRETRLGNGPWGLYLYREAGWDQDPTRDEGSSFELTGTPVLFVPGNAGSFRQVRSLASAATRSYFELPGEKRDGGRTREGGARLDFFTLDFNDDFSAFHGQTLFDQAEYTADAIRYILRLYDNRLSSIGPKPTSLVVVAHSMGGIVARAAFLDPRHQPRSISTIITLATPHLAPPVTIDSGVDRVYETINSFWRRGHDLSTSTPSSPTSALKVSPRDELRDLVLISINGGVSDEMIASESASLSSLVPSDDSHGFSVSTTAIPGVNTPIDHLAILWCRQLMHVVADTLLAIVDSRKSEGVVSRRDRIDEFETRLLGGLERRGSMKFTGGRNVSLSKLESGSTRHLLDLNERLVVRPDQSTPSMRSVYLLPVPPRITSFDLLSSSSIAHDLIEVYGCLPAPISEASTSSDQICTPLFPKHVTVLPESPYSPVSPVLPASVGDGTMNLISLDSDNLKAFEHIAVVARKPSRSDWVVAEFSNRAEKPHVVDRGAFHLLLSGYRSQVLCSGGSSLVSEIWLPALDTSLLVLKLKIHRNEAIDKESLFAPLVRQYSPSSHESKYYPNARETILYTHSSGPFLPSSNDPSSSSGARLQVFLDPTTLQDSSSTVEMSVEVDIWRTIGSLFLRYRLAMVTIPFALVLLIVGTQIDEFNKGHAFPTFGVAFSSFSRRLLPTILVSLWILSYIQSFLLSPYHAAPLAAVKTSTSLDSHLSLPPTWLANAILGNSGSFWSPVAPLLVLATAGIVAIEYLVLSLLINILAWLVGKVGPSRTRALFSLDTSQPQYLPTQRLVSLATLLLFTIVFAPYQFAYLVLFLIHLFTTVKLLVIAQSGEVVEEQHPSQSITTASLPTSNDRWDRFHFSFSILFVLLTLLPINALILVVWVRNLAVGWLAPFSSDHNVLRIIGFLCIVEAIHSGKLLQRIDPSTSPRLSRLIPIVGYIAAAYSLLYGIRSAHRIYTFANVWTLLVTFSTSRRIVSYLTNGGSAVGRKARTSDVEGKVTRRKASTVESSALS